MTGDERMPQPDDAETVGSAGSPPPTPSPAPPAAPKPSPAPPYMPAGADVRGMPQSQPDAPAPTGERPHPAPESAPADRPASSTAAPDGVSRPTVAPVSPDIDLAQDASPLPGAHRGGFQRLPTAPVAVTTQSAPSESGEELEARSAEWATGESMSIHYGLAAWALAFAIIGLAVSLFVGWGFPIGLVAVVSGIIALRRPLESRAVAVWGIVLGVVSILYSAGWLLFAAMQSNLLG